MNDVVVLASIFTVHILGLMSPGPNFLMVTQTAISCTRRAGIATALGIATGAAVWSSAALFGLNVVFMQFAWLYYGLKLLGGVYLLSLGLRLWNTADQPLVATSLTPVMARTDWQAFRVGLLTNLTNPASAIFFGSIFAALLTPNLPLCVKIAAIGIIVIDAASWHTAVACIFSTRHAQQLYQRCKRWSDRLAGSALAFLGMRLLLSRS